MRPSRPILIAVVVLILGALAFLSIRIVPADRIAVVESSGNVAPARGPVIFAPGGRVTFYPRSPQTLTFPAPADTAGGVYRIFSAEGAEVRLSVKLRYVIRPDEVVAFHRQAHGDADRAVRSFLKTAIRETAVEFGVNEIAGGGENFSRSLRDRLRLIGAELQDLTIEGGGIAPGGEQSLARARAQKNGRKVLVLGVDAGDWTIINRLRAAGRLKTLDAALKTGASGPLRSIEPLLSPLIWTTIATGVGPEKHGILDFLTPDPATGKMVPATSRLRTAPAIWNLAPAYGRSAGVVGWLATSPPEPIDGFIVTDRFGFLAFAGQAADPTAADVAHPPDLLADRADRAVSSASIPTADVGRFLKVPAAEIDAARRTGYEKGNRIGNFIHTLATAESYAHLGLDLYRSERADLMMVYFEFVDATCHLFMPFAPPLRPEISGDDARRFGGTVDEAYVRQDEILGSFVDGISDSTIVVILSDHGFRSGDTRLAGTSDMEAGNAPRWHLPDGILILDGPGVRPGARITGATVFDVAPTILGVLGCPIPASCRGRVLAEAFEPGFFAAADTIRSADVETSGYAPPVAAVADGTTSGEDRRSEEGGAADRSAEASKHVNLGIVMARSGDAAGAEREFRKALELAPKSRTATNNLASIFIQQKRFRDAKDVLGPLLETDPGYAPAWNNLAVCEQNLANVPGALTAYTRSLTLEPSDQLALTNRGFLYLDLKRPADAETDFRRALSIVPAHVPARYGLGAACAMQGRTAEAIRELDAVLAADPAHAGARDVLNQLRSRK